MDIDSYMTNFSQTTINQDTHSWNHAYFLMLDDQQTATTASTDSKCNGCTQHVLKVKNLGEAQKIHVGAHVWQDRGYGWGTTEERNCSGAIYAQPHHSIYETGSDYYSGIFDAGQGDKWIPPYQFAKNEEKEFTVMLNWNREGVVKDWSLTAWGTQHGVSVTHTDPNLSTDHMPQLSRGNRKTPTEIIVPPPPPTPPPSCLNLDNGAVDPYGDGCLAYNAHPEWCGGYDDADFTSGTMCCACNGGKQITCADVFGEIAGSDNKISWTEWINNNEEYGKRWTENQME